MYSSYVRRFNYFTHEQLVEIVNQYHRINCLIKMFLFAVYSFRTPLYHHEKEINQKIRFYLSFINVWYKGNCYVIYCPRMYLFSAGKWWWHCRHSTRTWFIQQLSVNNYFLTFFPRIQENVKPFFNPDQCLNKDNNKMCSRFVWILWVMSLGIIFPMSIKYRICSSIKPCCAT